MSEILSRRKTFYKTKSRMGYVHQMVQDLFTGQKLASNVLVSFCAKSKKTLLFNETTSNYHYANYVTSRMSSIGIKFQEFI